jgi:hypothetical protein
MVTEQEGTKLQQLAKALAEGNRHSALRVIRQFLANPPSKLLEAKRLAWETWQAELKDPDPEHSDKQLMTMLINGSLPAKDFTTIKKQYDGEVSYHGQIYHHALLVSLLLELYERFRKGPEIPKRVSKEKGREIALE